MRPSISLGAGAARGTCVVLAVLLTALAGGARRAEAARKPDPLAAARQFYNSGQYDEAIQAAELASSNPASASSARLVLGRSRLERYRKTNAADDLDAARTALRALDPRALDPHERVELQIGLAVVLFFEDHFGASAELLDPLLDLSGTTQTADAHERALDWWASGLNREALGLAPSDREPIYDRVIDRMERELRRDSISPTASYWLAAAARGSGDLDRAWAAACASWVRATLAPDRGTGLRADLDKLVTQAIIPERATKTPAMDRRQAIASLTAEWEAFKANWAN